eukprot:a339518_462.p2 GENE.a339518_462~~a339518_462.p2  ORF type:complete len:315 (-),score=162.62 a339518_462:77-979(-)
MAARRLSSSGLGADVWIPQQKKAFTSWVNSKLAERSLILDRDLASAFDDGLFLIPLVEVLTGAKAGKFSATPSMRIHKQNNIEVAFRVLEQHNFHPDIHVEEVCDANEKMILGFIWQLFVSYGSKDNTSNAELLAWVQARVNNNPRYEGVNVTEFSKSWQDGKAFAALIDSLSPSIFDYAAADKGDVDDDVHTKKRAMLDKVFAAAQAKLNVPQCLESADIVAFAPDDKSCKMFVTLVKNAWGEKEAELRAAAEAEAARRAAMTKEDALAELDAALAKLEKLKTCPQCHFDLAAWLAANP